MDYQRLIDWEVERQRDWPKHPVANWSPEPADVATAYLYTRKTKAGVETGACPRYMRDCHGVVMSIHPWWGLMGR